MRTRALIAIVLTIGWLLPSGAIACPTGPEAVTTHAHGDHHDGHAHAHPGADDGDARHDHAAAGDHGHAAASHHDHAAPPALAESGTAAPGHAPTCCKNDAKTPVLTISLPEFQSRPNPNPLAVLAMPPHVPQPGLVLSGSRLRLRQPAPLPYARTHRPLLI